MANDVELKTMRITQLSYSSAGGAGAVANTLNNALREQGVDSNFLHCSSSTLMENPLENITTTILASLDEFVLKRRSFQNQLSVSRNHNPHNFNLEVLNSEIINLHWIPGYVKVNSLSRIAQRHKGVIWTLHDLWPITGGCHYSQECNSFTQTCSNCPACRTPFSRLIENEQRSKKETLEALADKFAFVAPSNWIAKLARQSNVGKNLRIEVIPNPVQAQNPDAASKEEARHLLNVEKNTLLVAFSAANIRDKRKNLDLLIHSLNLLLKTEPNLDIKLLLIGRGEKLETQSFTIIQPGFLDKNNLSKMLKAADVFVNLSREENLSVAAVEALALQIPVIALDSGGNHDLIEDGVSGFLVQNSDELCEKLKELSKNPELLRGLSLGAHNRYLNKFSTAQAASRYLELYESFL